MRIHVCTHNVTGDVCANMHGHLVCTHTHMHTSAYRYGVVCWVRLFNRRLIDDNRSIFVKEVRGLSDPRHVDMAPVFRAYLPKGHLTVICIRSNEFIELCI